MQRDRRLRESESERANERERGSKKDSIWKHCWQTVGRSTDPNVHRQKRGLKTERTKGCIKDREIKDDFFCKRDLQQKENGKDKRDTYRERHIQEAKCELQGPHERQRDVIKNTCEKGGG